MGCGTSFVKYVLFIFNLVVALVGLAIVGAGVAVLLNWKVIAEVLQGHMSVAPWLFIAIGAITFLIAFFGCCGAIRESHCMVVTYAISLLVIIILQVVLAVLMFTFADSLKESIVGSVNGLYDSMATDTSAKVLFNNIETQLECCGKSSPADYALQLRVDLPKSCCTRAAGIIGQTFNVCTLADANSVGCASRAADLYEKWNKPIAAVAIGVACVEVVGALFALCLANSITNMDRRSRY